MRLHNRPRRAHVCGGKKAKFCRGARWTVLGRLAAGYAHPGVKAFVEQTFGGAVIRMA